MLGAVRVDWPTLAHADDLSGSSYARGDEVLGLDTHERRATGQHLRASSPPDRRAQRDDVVRDHPEQEREQHEARPDRLDAEGHVLLDVAGKHGLVAGGGHLKGDLTARVSGPDDEDRTGRQLAGIAVPRGVDLKDRPIELRRDRGDPGHLVRRHRDDDVLGLDPLGSRLDYEAISGSAHSVDPNSVAHREREGRCVGLQVVGDLILGGEAVPSPGQAHAVEVRVAADAEEPK